MVYSRECAYKSGNFPTTTTTTNDLCHRKTIFLLNPTLLPLPINLSNGLDPTESDMSRAILRNATVSRLLQQKRHCVAEFSGNFTSPVTRNRVQSHAGYSFRFPHFHRKARDYDLYPPSLFAFSFSSSSSSASSLTRVGFIGWYLGMIRSRPILTKSVTSSLIYLVADFSSQTIARYISDEAYDFVRTARMAGYGLLILGPTLHFWFNFMSKLFPKQDIAATLKKMFMAQTLYGPVMTVVFFSLNAALQGENGAEIVCRLKRDLLPTMLNGVMYWPMCDFITYKFTPVHLQPLVSNSFSFLWTVYMTYMAGLEKAGD